MMNIVFTIKTSYSEENYFLTVDKNKSIEMQIGEALAEICFCDAYEIVSYEEVDESYAEERNRLIEKYEELFNESVAEAFLSGEFTTLESIEGSVKRFVTGDVFMTNMISCYGIEHWDNLGDSVVFWCIAGDVPQKYIEKAVQIDKENYSSDCFGACAIFDVDGFHMCQDSPNCELYYIDNDGDKHWFEKVFTDEEAKTFFEGCFEEIVANLPQ